MAAPDVHIAEELPNQNRALHCTAPNETLCTYMGVVSSLPFRDCAAAVIFSLRHFWVRSKDVIMSVHCGRQPSVGDVASLT